MTTRAPKRCGRLRRKHLWFPLEGSFRHYSRCARCGFVRYHSPFSNLRDPRTMGVAVAPEDEIDLG